MLLCYRRWQILWILSENYGTAMSHRLNNAKAQQYIADYYNPDYVSEHFAVLLKRHGLCKIRFHDLRHSCASTMLALGKQMKDVQMWIGHSDIGTTGNIYSHLDSHSKVQTGAAIYDALTD